MLHTLFDITCLAVGGVLGYFCIRDPYGNFNEADRVRTEGHMVHVLPFLNVLKPIHAFFFFVELYLQLQPHSYLFPLPDVLQRSFPSLFSVGKSSLVPSGFRSLVLLTYLVSGALRLWSMHTLGRLFTFTLSIRKGHRLITDGPYAYVRHPSYTGSYGLAVSGTFIIATSELAERAAGLRTLIVHTGWLGALGVMIATFGGVVICHRMLWPRIKNEEEMLEGEFGNEWVLYKRNVPYGVFPFIW